jgi:hypothetical protein
MHALRSKHGSGDTEISFKDLRKGQIKRMLSDYLETLDTCMPGFLFTIAIEKNIKSLFGSQSKSTLEELSYLMEQEGLGKRKKEVTEKLLRITHITAFLIAILAHHEHQIFWMTDHDDICANEAAHQQLLSTLQRILPIYRPDSCPFTGQTVIFLSLVEHGLLNPVV